MVIRRPARRDQAGRPFAALKSRPDPTSGIPWVQSRAACLIWSPTRGAASFSSTLSLNCLPPSGPGLCVTKRPRFDNSRVLTLPVGARASGFDRTRSATRVRCLKSLILSPRPRSQESLESRIRSPDSGQW